MDSTSTESPLVYNITPELRFTPSLAKVPKSYIIGDTLESTECRVAEFKCGPYVIDNLSYSIQRYGSAFLNSEGGTLLLGILDNGTVIGVDSLKFDKDSIRRRIREEFKLFKPPVTEDLYEIYFVKTDVRWKYVVEIHVRPGHPDEIYVGQNKKMYVRRDGSVQGPLWPKDIEEIVLDKLEKKNSASS